MFFMRAPHTYTHFQQFMTLWNVHSAFIWSFSIYLLCTNVKRYKASPSKQTRERVNRRLVAEWKKNRGELWMKKNTQLEGNEKFLVQNSESWIYWHFTCMLLYLSSWGIINTTYGKGETKSISWVHACIRSLLLFAINIHRFSTACVCLLMLSNAFKNWSLIAIRINEDKSFLIVCT